MGVWHPLKLSTCIIKHPISCSYIILWHCYSDTQLVNERVARRLDSSRANQSVGSSSPCLIHLSVCCWKKSSYWQKLGFRDFSCWVFFLSQSTYLFFKKLILLDLTENIQNYYYINNRIYFDNEYIRRFINVDNILNLLVKHIKLVRLHFFAIDASCREWQAWPLMHTAPIDPNKQQAPLEFFFHAISFLSRWSRRICTKLPNTAITLHTSWRAAHARTASAVTWQRELLASGPAKATGDDG
jgi:hypothetical protein